MLQRIRPAALVFVLAPAASAQFQVWTVDDDGPADFASIQAAVDAAVDTDVILVRDGDYAPFTVDGKGLSVLGDGDAVRILFGLSPLQGVVVRDVPAGARTHLRNFEFIAGPTYEADFLRVDDCAGVVVLADLSNTVPLPQPFGYTITIAEAWEITNSDHVVVSNCAVEGPDGTSPGFGLEAGADGLRAVDSTVYAFDSLFLAGYTLVQGGQGQSAIDASGGFLVLRDCTAQGAGGGGGFQLLGQPPGKGGSGLFAGAGCVAHSINSQLLGGPGGVDALGGGPVGPDGESFVGNVTESAANPARFDATAIIRDDAVDDDVYFTLESAPSSAVFLLASFGTAPLFLPDFAETIVSEFPPIVIAAGGTDANGDLAWSLGIPTLPPAFQTWNATVQAAVFTAAPELEISSPAIFTVVDDAF